METVKVKVDEQFLDRQFYRENPLKTDKISLSLYDFEPWQALRMQKNPGSDTIMYFVDGDAFMLINDAVFAVGPGDAMYVPANSTYGVLAGENDLNVVAVQGPKPVQTEPVQSLVFRCPDCELEAPLTTGTKTGDINMCPRCETMVKLTEQPQSFRAEKTAETPPQEQETITEPMPAAEGAGEPQARMEFGVIDFQPWQALSMHKNPNNDTILYVVQGQGIVFIDDEEKSVDSNEAIYIPAGATYGIMAADNQMTVMSVQGPLPIEAQDVGGLEYNCPICDLETPVTSNTFDGCITVCPRCNVKLKLTKAGDMFKAEETTEQAPTEAEAQ